MWKLSLVSVVTAQISDSTESQPLPSTPIRGPSYKKVRVSGDSGLSFIDYNTQIANFFDFNIEHLTNDAFKTTENSNSTESWQFWSKNGTICEGFSLCAVNDYEITDQGFSGACMTASDARFTTACYKGNCSTVLPHITFSAYAISNADQIWTYKKSTKQLLKINTTLCLSVLAPDDENFENSCSEFYSPPEFLGGGHLFVTECENTTSINYGQAKNQQWNFVNGLIQSECAHGFHVSAAHPFATLAKNDKDSQSNLLRFGDEIDIPVQLAGDDSAFSTILEIYLNDPVILSDVLTHARV